MASIRDIARIAGVSPASVSRILMKNARKSPYFNAGMDRTKLT